MCVRFLVTVFSEIALIMLKCEKSSTQSFREKMLYNHIMNNMTCVAYLFLFLLTGTWCQ